MSRGPERTSFAAMGTACEILVSGSHGSWTTSQLLHSGSELVGQLESRWSRFLPTSDISRVNQADGDFVQVHKFTVDAVTVATAASAHTEGRYNPLIGRAMVSIGYDRPFRHGSSSTESSDDSGHICHVLASAQDRDSETPAASAGEIVIDRSRCQIRIPSGTALDLGGIGKGYAGDLVADALLALGATGVMVNLGGDVRVAGEAPDGKAWTIQIGNLDEAIVLLDGAVAFSTTAKRRWLHRGLPMHHLLDPRSGTSLAVDLAMVCTVTSAGWWSEALAKSISVEISRAGGSRVESILNTVVPAGDHATVQTADGRWSTALWSSVSGRLELENA
jgi:FAD:protein FMN transferase